MTTAKRYIEGLKNAYAKAGLAQLWEEFEQTVCGISENDRAKLIAMYPDIPQSLLELLELADGTYWRQYSDEEVTFYMLGSDVDDGGYPYYLYSAQQLMEQSDVDYAGNFADLFYYCEEEGRPVDDRLRSDGSAMCWLCFSDCMNNGGTSKLFIDFTPSESGTKGQIIRFLHDPDEVCVIADSFDEYLEMIMRQGFAFVDPELM